MNGLVSRCWHCEPCLQPGVPGVHVPGIVPSEFSAGQPVVAAGASSSHVSLVSPVSPTISSGLLLVLVHRLMQVWHWRPFSGARLVDSASKGQIYYYSKMIGYLTDIILLLAGYLEDLLPRPRRSPSPAGRSSSSPVGDREEVPIYVGDLPTAMRNSSRPMDFEIMRLCRCKVERYGWLRVNASVPV